MSNIIDKIQLSGVTYDIGGSGSPTIELTQSEYNALVTAGTVSADTYYIITDAQAGDLTQYWTSAQTNSAITEAVSGKANSSDVYLKSETSGATEISTALASKVDSTSVVTAVTSASTDNEIPTAKAVWEAATGGGGDMTEDDELLLSTALTDLNDRKIDASEVKSNYQKKGDYATKSYVTTALEPYETKLDEINTEEVTAYALNDLNDRFGGLRIVKITESEYAALTTKDENTLYVVVADPT